MIYSVLYGQCLVSPVFCNKTDLPLVRFILQKTWFLYNQSILLKGNVCPANILPTDLSAYNFFYLVYEYNSLSFCDCLEGIIWFDATLLE